MFPTKAIVQPIQLVVIANTAFWFSSYPGLSLHFRCTVLFNPFFIYFLFKFLQSYNLVGKLSTKNGDTYWTDICGRIFFSDFFSSWRTGFLLRFRSSPPCLLQSCWGIDDQNNSSWQRRFTEEVFWVKKRWILHHKLQFFVTDSSNYCCNLHTYDCLTVRCFMSFY